MIHFQIESEQITLRRILLDIENEIDSWPGVELRLCKVKKTTFKQYKRTSTNWFNRNKAKIFGTNLFHILIFGHIYKVRYLFHHLFIFSFLKAPHKFHAVI